MKIRKIISTTVLSALVCFGLCQQLQSATDTPDPGGSLPTSNTADGQGALGSLTTGLYNSAFGFLSLLSNADANFNTGVGAGALLANTASTNTAVGAGALLSNTSGFGSTAIGAFSLFSSTGLGNNTAVGASALQANTTGSFNTAAGHHALGSNLDGIQNTAVGLGALNDNTSGTGNTALGVAAGSNATTGNGNVYLGAGMDGVAGEANHTYIRNITTTTDLGTGTIQFVLVNQDTGLLGRSAVSFNEFLNAHKKIEEQQASIAELKSTIAQQQKGMEVLTAQLKEQGAQIQKVSAEIEVSKPGTKVVANK
jgi:uncharacterized coiled-coil protein SlyX